MAQGLRERVLPGGLTDPFRSPSPGPDVIGAVGAFVPAFEAVGTGGATLVTGVSALDIAPAVRDQVREGDIVLLKGSRGMRLEMLLAAVWPSAAPQESH